MAKINTSKIKNDQNPPQPAPRKFYSAMDGPDVVRLHKGSELVAKIAQYRETHDPADLELILAGWEHLCKGNSPFYICHFMGYRMGEDLLPLIAGIRENGDSPEALFAVLENHFKGFGEFFL